MRQSISHSMRMSRGNSVYRGGSNLLTGNNSTFSGAGNWKGTNLGTFDVNSTVAGKLYMLGDGGADTTYIANTIISGNRYRTKLKARLNAGASTTIRAGSNTNNTYFSFTPTGIEQTFIGYFTSNGTTLEIGIGAVGGGFNGIAFEIDDVEVIQLGAVS